MSIKWDSFSQFQYGRDNRESVKAVRLICGGKSQAFLNETSIKLVLCQAHHIAMTLTAHPQP